MQRVQPVLQPIPTMASLPCGYPVSGPRASTFRVMRTPPTPQATPGPSTPTATQSSPPVSTLALQPALHAAGWATRLGEDAGVLTGATRPPRADPGPLTSWLPLPCPRILGCWHLLLPTCPRGTSAHHHRPCGLRARWASQQQSLQGGPSSLSPGQRGAHAARALSAVTHPTEPRPGPRRPARGLGVSRRSEESWGRPRCGPSAGTQAPRQNTGSTSTFRAQRSVLAATAKRGLQSPAGRRRLPAVCPPPQEPGYARACRQPPGDPQGLTHHPGWCRCPSPRPPR